MFRKKVYVQIRKKMNKKIRGFLLLLLAGVALWMGLSLFHPTPSCAQSSEDCGECTKLWEGKNYEGVWVPGWFPGTKDCAICATEVQ